MRYQLGCNQGWSIKGGAVLIPQGTIIDSGSNDPWSSLVTGLNPPLNAIPQDQATYDLMKTIYPAHQIITFPGADGIIR